MPPPTLRSTRCGRAAGECPVRADPRPLQGVHHRRSAHALALGVQRHAQDPRGAARAREVHPGHHRSAEGPGHGAVALPAIQPEADPGAADPRPARPCAPAGSYRVRAGCARSDRARCTWQHARRAEPARSSDRARCRQRDRGLSAGDAGRGRPGVSVRAAGRAGRPRRAGDDAHRRADAGAQPVARGRAPGAGEPAVPAGALADGAGRGACRRARSRSIAGAGRALLRGGSATRLSDRLAGTGRSVAGSRRVRGLHHDPAAHAGLRAAGERRQRSGRHRGAAAQRKSSGPAQPRNENRPAQPRTENRPAQPPSETPPRADRSAQPGSGARPAQPESPAQSESESPSARSPSDSPAAVQERNETDLNSATDGKAAERARPLLPARRALRPGPWTGPSCWAS